MHKKYAKHSQETKDKVLIDILCSKLSYRKIGEKYGISMWVVRDWARKADSTNRQVLRDAFGKTDKLDKLEKRVARLERIIAEMRNASQ